MSNCNHVNQSVAPGSYQYGRVTPTPTSHSCTNVNCQRKLLHLQKAVRGPVLGGAAAENVQATLHTIRSRTPCRDIGSTRALPLPDIGPSPQYCAGSSTKVTSANRGNGLGDGIGNGIMNGMGNGFGGGLESCFSHFPRSAKRIPRQHSHVTTSAAVTFSRNAHQEPHAWRTHGKSPLLISDCLYANTIKPTTVLKVPAPQITTRDRKAITTMPASPHGPSSKDTSQAVEHGPRLLPLPYSTVDVNTEDEGYLYTQIALSADKLKAARSKLPSNAPPRSKAAHRDVHGLSDTPNELGLLVACSSAIIQPTTGALARANSAVSR